MSESKMFSVKLALTEYAHPVLSTSGKNMTAAVLAMDRTEQDAILKALGFVDDAGMPFGRIFGTLAVSLPIKGMPPEMINKARQLREAKAEGATPKVPGEAPKVTGIWSKYGASPPRTRKTHG